MLVALSSLIFLETGLIDQANERIAQELPVNICDDWPER